MVLTEKAAVAQMRMSDGEWLLKNTPQRFRPSSIGMVFDEKGLFVHYQDFIAIVAYFQGAALREIAGSAETLTSETPKESLVRLQGVANMAMGGAE